MHSVNTWWIAVLNILFWRGSYNSLVGWSEPYCLLAIVCLEVQDLINNLHCSYFYSLKSFIHSLYKHSLSSYYWQDVVIHCDSIRVKRIPRHQKVQNLGGEMKLSTKITVWRWGSIIGGDTSLQKRRNLCPSLVTLKSFLFIIDFQQMNYDFHYVYSLGLLNF